MSEWHGWRRRGSGQGALHVGFLPGRKQACLYRLVGSQLEVLAYFRSEGHARQALKWLDDYSGEAVAPVSEPDIVPVYRRRRAVLVGAGSAFGRGTDHA